MVHQGHGGEFSGYYCKVISVINNKLLCLPKDRNSTMITGVPECLGDPASYCSLDPEIPPHFQQWLMVWMPRENAYKIINRHSGMLLCVPSRTDQENQRIVHYHDQAQLNLQWWEVQAFGYEEFKVVNKKSGKVLTAKDGSVVQQTSNETSDIQMWNIIPLERSGFIGEYQIKNVNASKLLCIKSESLSNNTRAVIHDDRTGTVHEEFSNFQWWRLFVRGWDEGGFVLQNCRSGKILCISQRSMNSGIKAIQYHDQELSYQKWKLESVLTSPDRNLMQIANYSSGLMLSVQDSAQGINDAPVIQCEGKNLPFQFWEFIKLSEEINLQKLIKFFNSEPKSVNRKLRDEDLGTNLSPKLLQWYQNFIKMFMLEIFSIVGVIPLPSREQLTALNHLILGSSSILSKLQVLLETELSFDTIIQIVKLISEEDLWNQIFRLLFEQVWSLPTLIKATAVINSICKGVGTARTVFLLQKAATVLGILYSIKPAN